MEIGHRAIDEVEDERREGHTNQEAGEEEMAGVLVVLFE
jgi:hypothetical protein